ncbi:MAG TPA: hypothetical protein VKP68_14160, partial [Ramlibacter sp.]|nr:hypothetical protein [Ramlibacter sp.]
MTGTPRAGNPGGIDALRWTAPRLGEALEELARRAHLRPAAGESPGVPASPAAQEEREQDRWIDWAAQRLGLEAEAVDAVAPELDALLRGAAPALLRFADGEGTGFLLLLKATGRVVHLIGPDLRVHERDAAVLRNALCAPYEAPYAAEIDGLLAAAEVQPQRRA